MSKTGSDTIESEMLHLVDLQHVSMALLQFARSLSGGEFVKAGAAWIYRPNNFVGFEIRFKRTKKLNVLTRPVRVSDDVKELLRNWKGPLGYLRLEVDSPRKLGAACMYIEASSKRRVSSRRKYLSAKSDA
jgi:hypothetical protein